jgi:signal transduction histidine kinase
VRSLGDAQESAAQAVKYIGGLTVLRDRPGTGRPPLMPVAPEKQRAALDLVTREVLSPDSFRIPPKLLREASVSFYDQLDAEELGRSPPPLDFSIDQRVLGVQRVVLSQLMSEQTAQRLVNNATRVDSANQSIRLSELYATLHTAIWSELKSGRDINLFRRNLQREHTTRIATALLRPAATMPADARALLREEAKSLRQEIAAAQTKRGASYSKEARAHLAEMQAELDEALKAPIVRQGV